MPNFDLRPAAHIGDGARHLQDTVVAASRDLRAGFAAATWLAQALELHARNVYMQVQTIEQRTRNPGAIPLHLISSAATSIVRVAEIATRTRVHRRDQLEARRKFRLARR